MGVLPSPPRETVNGAIKVGRRSGYTFAHMVAAPLYYVAAASYGFMRTNGCLVVWSMVLLLWTLDDNVA
jgi:hypothetical protein